jgi:hypothetical protein
LYREQKRLDSEGRKSSVYSKLKMPYSELGILYSKQERL